MFQWLRALPTSKTSFNLVFGECPYCNKVCKPLDSGTASHRAVYRQWSTSMHESSCSGNSTLKGFNFEGVQLKKPLRLVVNIMNFTAGEVLVEELVEPLVLFLS